VLDGAACLTGGFCAVTGSIDSSANTVTSGSTWINGTSSSAVRYFWGVSCPISRICYAVGTSTGYKGIIMKSTDGGLNWFAQTIPSGSGTLYGISCVDIDHCMAVGSSSSTPGKGHGVAMVTVDGKIWTATSVPTGSISLQGVTCRTATWCQAVGGSSAFHALVYTYH
jgi:hypothetical protein